MTLPAYERKKIPSVNSITSFGEPIDPVAALRACEVGACFVVDSERFRYRMAGFARRLGFTIKTKRNEQGKYDIWRLS